MITTILSDFSRVILFPSDDTYKGSLNDLNRELIKKQGENYDFFKYFTLNDDIITMFKDLKDNREIYIFTSDTIQNQPAVRKILDPLITDMLSAKLHNLNKKESAAYEFIVKKLEKIPETFLYIDDLLENVEAAQKAGMNAIHFKNNKQLKEALQSMDLLAT